MLHNEMKILLIFILLFLIGCGTLQEKNIYEKFYIKTCNCFRKAEYFGLKDKISKQEYHILPLNLQNCYVEEE